MAGVGLLVFRNWVCGIISGEICVHLPTHLRTWDPGCRNLEPRSKVNFYACWGGSAPPELPLPVSLWPPPSGMDLQPDMPQTGLFQERATFRPSKVLPPCTSYSRNEVQERKRGAVEHVFIHRIDAVLVGIVSSAGDAIFAKFYRKCLKQSKLHILRYRTCHSFQDALFSRSANDGTARRQGLGSPHKGYLNISRQPFA